MAARSCVECGMSVTTEFCPHCGARQPGWTEPTGTPSAGSDLETTALPLGALPMDPPTTAIPGSDDGEQPWHPFEQPSWYPGYADPRAVESQSRRGWAPGTPTELGPDFMGVSQWQTEPPETPADRNRSWLLGSLAAVAVVLVLGLVAFLVIRGQGSQSATPDATNPATVAATTPTTGTPTPDPSSAPAPAVTVTTTEVTEASTEASASAETTASSADTVVSSEAPSSDETATSAAAPLGGPVRDIACAPGYIVQIASGVDEASFTSRVAELGAAGQLPPDSAVARTGTSCGIFAGQSNSIVLYAGPFANPYDGCAARLAAAPDSFIKGTTPETARQYVSCLCPTQVITIPTFTTVGQTGIWVGELQRTLANRLNIAIPDLGGTWGTFSQSTSDAVKQFQTSKGLQPTGQVGAETWQALQTAEC